MTSSLFLLTTALNFHAVWNVAFCRLAQVYSVEWPVSEQG